MNTKRRLFMTVRTVLAAGLMVACLLTGRAANADSISAAQGVFNRVIGPTMTASISLSTIPQVDGRDVYEYEAAGGVLTVRGSSSVAMCRGVYDYLRANSLGTVGWAGPRLNLPAAWPDFPLTQGETPFKVRHCYNVVTAGYTFPFWTWDRWQQELDWLAMHGYNMMMAPVANEAILTRVWEDIGLTQAEIDEYFTGPAHLPWNRMGNIRQVGGTMTDAWHTDQIALQHQILGRARELGIEPVVQGFAGFVPPGITRIHPGLTLHTSSNWAGFSGDNNTKSIMPDEPLFADITARYITAWSNEFGDAQYYLVDSFNEMSLPAGDPETLLAGYGLDTYNALVNADPDAIWVLQGWMFQYQTNIWTPATVAALMNAVPDDNRLLVLDYANDYTDYYNLSGNAWERYNGFEGKSWVMGYVPNMGGKTGYTGKMEYYASQAAATLQDPAKSNLVGFTISGEGFDNNEVLFELMSDTAWSSNSVDLTQWLPAYAENRYGQAVPEVASAWEQLRHSVYSSFTDHPSFGWQKLNLGQGSVYRGTSFIQAVDTFLSAADTLGSDPNYTDDAVEMAALALGLRAEEYFVLANSAYNSGDNALCQTNATKAVDLLLQADRLLESHSQHRLQRWIDLARAHNGTTAEKDEYERSARQIVTIWGGPHLHDYSCRVWSGLIRDFYVPRMEAKIAAMLAGESFNRDTFELAWVNATGVSAVTPYADPAVKAKELFTAAYDEVLDNLPNLDDIVGRWYPNQMSTDWVVLEWHFPADKLADLDGVTFSYTGGAHRLDISRAAIVADGVEVVVDEHAGSTGLSNENNFYLLHVPEGTQANNSCKLRATVRSDGGTDSSGIVYLKLKSAVSTALIAPSSVIYTGTAPEAAGINLDVENNIVNSNGLSAALLDDGSNLGVVSHETASFDPPGNAWVTTDPGGADSDFFSSAPGTVSFEFNLGGSVSGIDALVSWGYHFGAHNGNSISDVTLYFSTDGGTTTNSSQTIAVPLPESHNLASIVTFTPVAANHITMTVNDNHYNGTPGFGGDRVGIAEIRFASGFTTPPVIPIGEIGVGGLVPVPGGEGFALSWGTADGQPYEVQYKTNLTDQTEWIVATNITGTGGGITITAAVDLAECFYRIVTP